MAIPLLDALDLTGKTVTADALLTQRTLAAHLRDQQAHYVFIVKSNQPTLYKDIRLLFEQRGQPDFREAPTLSHGRIETRSIWTSTRLNGYLDFPGIAQVFAIERAVINKKTGKSTSELVYGITSHSPQSADAAKLLAFNRNHWAIENSCHYILDCTWNEDRNTIRTDHGPENFTMLCRFAIGLIKARAKDSVAATTKRLARNLRLVFDYLRMTKNSQPRLRPSGARGT